MIKMPMKIIVQTLIVQFFFFSALDINECLFDVARCSADADCVNTAGSYSCKCHSGFTGDGFSCRKGLLSLCGLDKFGAPKL